MDATLTLSFFPLLLQPQFQNFWDTEQIINKNQMQQFANLVTSYLYLL